MTSPHETDSDNASVGHRSTVWNRSVLGVGGGEHNPTSVTSLTDSTDWDAYWRADIRDLPVELTHRSGLQVSAILDVFDGVLAGAKPQRVLEVGGSPGRYLAYLHRSTGCKCSILDLSPHGCELARENFRLLDIPLSTYEGDILTVADLPRFDLVYSLGLVEHFTDLDRVVKAHQDLVSDGGRLILGVPNFGGVNGWMARRIDPSRIAGQNIESESIDVWERFEDRLGLERIFLGYVGGFEPGVFAVARERPRNVPLWLIANALSLTIGRLSSLRRFNHRSFSGYLMGAWRVNRSVPADVRGS
jgi:SAM-dependent methyltransferase